MEDFIDKGTTFSYEWDKQYGDHKLWTSETPNFTQEIPHSPKINKIFILRQYLFRTYAQRPVTYGYSRKVHADVTNFRSFIIAAKTVSFWKTFVFKMEPKSILSRRYSNFYSIT